MTLNKSPLKSKNQGFSLVEILTAVGIIGIILFLAIPNIIRVREESEVNVAIARAEAVNMSLASYIQTVGRNQADKTWKGKKDEDRYTLIKPYLAYAPEKLTDYMPSGYKLELPKSLTALEKAKLFSPTDLETPISY